MKKPVLVFSALVFAALLFSACTPVVPAASEPEAETAVNAVWTQEHITNVPPILMRDPFLELLGQTEEPIPYTYEEVVKLSGHSCGATAGAWTITKKALEALYPAETPVRGQILIHAPGAEDEWHVGVFGEVMTYITGAAPKTGFSGAEFGKGDTLYIRRNKMTYAEEPSNTPPPQMEWIFERADTGKKVSVKYNVMAVQPAATEEWTAMGVKMASGKATAEEAAEYVKYWNERAAFVFLNTDKEGLFTVTALE